MEIISSRKLNPINIIDLRVKIINPEIKRVLNEPLISNKGINYLNQIYRFLRPEKTLIFKIAKIKNWILIREEIRGILICLFDLNRIK